MLEKVKTWFRRLRYYTKKDILTFNNIVFAIALVLCLVWTYGAINSMSRNWILEEKLKNRQLEATKLKLEVETLKLEQEYYQTDKYLNQCGRSMTETTIYESMMKMCPVW